LVGPETGIKLGDSPRVFWVKTQNVSLTAKAQRTQRGTAQFVSKTRYRIEQCRSSGEKR